MAPPNSSNENDTKSNVVYTFCGDQKFKWVGKYTMGECRSTSVGIFSVLFRHEHALRIPNHVWWNTIRDFEQCVKEHKHIARTQEYDAFGYSPINWTTEGHDRQVDTRVVSLSEFNKHYGYTSANTPVFQTVLRRLSLCYKHILRVWVSDPDWPIFNLFVNDPDIWPKIEAELKEVCAYKTKE